MVESTEEKARARLAYCLTQWKRPGGGSIPQSEEGIAEHQELVEDYEAIYGPANSNSLRQYASVYANIRIGLEADRESDEVAEKFRRDEIARKEQEEVDSRLRKQALIEDQNRREAERILSMNSDLMPLLKVQVERLSRYVDRDTARVSQLQEMLESDRYRKSPLRGEIMGNMQQVEERLSDYGKRLANFNSDMEDAENEMAWARATLELSSGVEIAPDTPTTHKPSKEVVRDDPESVTAIPWTVNGKFMNTVGGIHPDINRLVIIDDGHGRYRGRVFTNGVDTIWLRDFADVTWHSGDQAPDGLRHDAHLTPEQYQSIKLTGRC